MSGSHEPIGGDALLVTPAKNVATARWTLFAMAASFGILTGAFELLMTLAQRAFDPRISLESLRTHRHFVWMIPVGDIGLFVGLGLVAAVLGWRWPHAARRVAWRLFTGLAALAGFLAIESIHPAASFALAAGAGWRVGGWLERAAEHWPRAVRVVPLLVGVCLVVVGRVSYVRTESAEREALVTRPAAAPDAPNVLWIVLDNVRAESLSLYGYDRPTSPNLQRIAREGICFTQARSPAPWTLPSHAAMFTAQWPHKLSVDWDLPLDRTYPTIAEYLATHGYTTAGFVANTYYANVRYGLDRGFDRYEDFYENRVISPYEITRSTNLGRRALQAALGRVTVKDGGAGERKSAAMISRDALQWIDDRPPDRPFFAFLNYFDAHSPFTPPDAPTPRFGTARLSVKERGDRLAPLKRMSQGKLTASDGDPAAIQRDAIEIYRDGYESCIAYLDHELGKFLDALADRGLRENTLIVITSDHGEHFMEHGFFGHGLSLYDREIRVPLVILPPRRAGAGQIVQTPVSLRDLAATSLRMIGLDEKIPFPGHSLDMLWTNAVVETASPSPAFSEVAQHRLLDPVPGVPSSQGAVTSLVVDGSLYIRNEGGREELYDLRTDPLERSNLITAPVHPRPASRFRNTVAQILSGEFDRLGGDESAPERIVRDEPLDPGVKEATLR